MNIYKKLYLMIILMVGQVALIMMTDRIFMNMNLFLSLVISAPFIPAYTFVIGAKDD